MADAESTKLILSNEAGSTGAEVIGEFRRSSGSTPTAAPTFYNMAKVIFDSIPQAERVVLVRADAGAILFIVQVSSRWFDVQANPITVRRAA